MSEEQRHGDEDSDQDSNPDQDCHMDCTEVLDLQIKRRKSSFVDDTGTKGNDTVIIFLFDPEFVCQPFQKCVHG